MSDAAPVKQWHNIKTVANIYDVSMRTVHRWVKEGKIKAIRVGRVVRVSEESLQAFDEQNEQQ